jgi:hypothetical protein
MPSLEPFAGKDAGRSFAMRLIFCARRKSEAFIQ